MNKLNPTLVAAFVFPDGSFLDARGNGHDAAARDYIKKVEIYNKQFKALSSNPKSRIYTAEDFLIDVLGAVKLASYCVLGKKIYYNEKLANPEIVKYYSDRGFKDPKQEISLDVPGYNQTVITKYVNGKKTLAYNPARIGD